MRSTDVSASTAGSSTLTISALRRQLLAHVRLPLHRDGYALALNSAFTAGTGLIYWILAAKTYSARSVGINSALISSMMFLAGIACLNLPNIIVRFLPESGDRTRDRVVGSYTLAAVVALCAATVFIVGVGAWAPGLGFLRTDHGLQLWFAFSTLAWCLFMIQDSVLTALGRAVWVPIENAAFSLVKIALLALLAVSMPVYGIFVSWTIGMLVSVVGVNIIVFARLMRPRPERARDTGFNLRDGAFARYFAADYACSFAWLAATNLMPVIVIAAAGPTANAYYALAYAVVLPFYAFGQNIGTSLMLHGARDPASLAALTRKAALQGARVLVPSAVLLVVLAPPLLSLFGGSYADHSTTVLRLLAVGALPNFVLVIAVSAARVRRRLRRAVIALAAEAVIVLGLATPLLHAFGVAGLGIGWLGSLSLIATALLLTSKDWLRADVVESSGAIAGDAK